MVLCRHRCLLLCFYWLVVHFNRSNSFPVNLKWLAGDFFGVENQTIA